MHNGLFSCKSYSESSFPLIGPCNESAYKNKQMQTSVPKRKSGLQSGFFDTQFKRIFEREALSDPVKQNRQYRIQQSKKNIGKTFLPSNGEKKP